MAQATDKKIFTGIGLDFETGGLNPTKSACTQIALQAIRFDTMELMERYSVYIAPYNKQNIGGAPRKILRNKYEIESGKTEPMEIEKTALDYSGITMEVLMSRGVHINEVAKTVIDFAQRNMISKGAQYKPVLIGQNIPFDIGFLQQMMNYAGLVKEFEKVFAGTTDFYGNFQPHYMDTLHLARLALADNPAVNSYKLELICEWLGIEIDDAHDADADVTATLDLVRVCTGRLRHSENSRQAIIREKNKTRNHFKI